MESKKETVVMYDSPEAAQIKTVTGWVDRDGRFWGEDEHMARYCGSTHHLCVCGEVTEKYYTICESCRYLKDIERYNAMPRKLWDGVSFLYSQSTDNYFRDLDEALEFLEEEASVDGDDGVVAPLESLRLVICEPNVVRLIDEDDWCDDLPEDGEAPDWLTEAVKAFNAVAKGKPPLSWSPGKFAMLVDTPEPATTPESTHDH